jgi:hypothetical protein
MERRRKAAFPSDLPYLKRVSIRYGKYGKKLKQGFAKMHSPVSIGL